VWAGGAKRRGSSDQKKKRKWAVEAGLAFVGVSKQFGGSVSQFQQGPRETNIEGERKVEIMRTGGQARINIDEELKAQKKK